jgi:hypothetical protein
MRTIHQADPDLNAAPMRDAQAEARLSPIRSSLPIVPLLYRPSALIGR